MFISTFSLYRQMQCHNCFYIPLTAWAYCALALVSQLFLNLKLSVFTSWRRQTSGSYLFQMSKLIKMKLSGILIVIDFVVFVFFTFWQLSSYFRIMQKHWRVIPHQKLHHTTHPQLKVSSYVQFYIREHSYIT